MTFREYCAAGCPGTTARWTDREQPLSMPTSTFHQLPEPLRSFLLVRHIAHRPSWQTQEFTLWERDLAEFNRRLAELEGG
jgi:hypothetical protein